MDGIRSKYILFRPDKDLFLGNIDFSLLFFWSKLWESLLSSWLVKSVRSRAQLLTKKLLLWQKIVGIRFVIARSIKIVLGLSVILNFQVLSIRTSFLCWRECIVLVMRFDDNILFKILTVQIIFSHAISDRTVNINRMLYLFVLLVGWFCVRNRIVICLRVCKRIVWSLLTVDSVSHNIISQILITRELLNLFLKVFQHRAHHLLRNRHIV